MANDALNLLDVFQSHLGSSRARCDAGGKLLWDRIEAVKLSTIDAQLYAASLESALMEIMNGKRKADRIPMEPMVRLIAFARTGSTANASIGQAKE